MKLLGPENLRLMRAEFKLLAQATAAFAITLVALAVAVQVLT